VTVLVTGFVTRLPAQTDPCLDRTIPVNVYTDRVDDVTPLAAANFKASISGKPILVRAATYDSGPRRIVILIHIPESSFFVPNPALRLIWDVTEFGDRVNFSLQAVSRPLRRKCP